MDTLLQDLRYALRKLARTPGFTAVAILTLALGIGATTAMFSVTNGVLLKPLPIDEQERLVLLYKEAPRDHSLRPFDVTDLTALRERSHVFAGVTGVQYDGAFPYVVQAGDRALSVMTSMVSGEFFWVLGVRPVAGRLTEPADAVAGAEPVVMISYGLWQREFGGDPSAVGRVIRFGQDALTIVGVAPRGFVYPKGVEVWVPLQVTRDMINNRFAPFSIIGRLRAGATLGQAQGEATAFVRDRETIYAPGEIVRGQRAVVEPFRDALIGTLRESVLILSAVVALVLVIAGVNVASLLMMRGVTRERELAVRTALGAGQGRIARQLLVETSVLAAAGGSLGIVLAYGAVRGLVAVAPAELPRLAEVSVDVVVLAFAVVVSIASTLLFGLAPAVWTVRAGVHPTLRGGPQGGSDSRRTRVIKQVLVVSQVALALVVVAGAGLLTNSLIRLQHVDMGFDATHLTLVKVAVPHPKYAAVSRWLTFFDQLVERLQALPGIAATPVVLAPFTGAGGWDATVTAEGQGQAAAVENPTLNLEPIAPNYFQTMGIPVRRGRAFTDQDGAGTLRVAIVGEATARRLWPGRDAVGRRLKFGLPDRHEPWLTVVGVVGDTRYRELAVAPASFYIPFRQTDSPGQQPTYLAVRSSTAAGAVISAVHAAAHELDPTVLVADAHPFARFLAAPLARPRFDTLLLSGFSVIALVLAAVGLYGTMAAFVSQRTHEIGVRLAIGAQAGDVRRLVLGRGMFLAAIGIVLGLLAALGTGRLFAGVVYGVSPADPMTLLGAATVLLSAAFVACAVPARRATRVDPMVALRHE
jgi:putative ABC transport system permease protein